MMPAANQGVGMNMGFPDVCTTPMAPAPVPIPYPNIGMNAMAMPFVPNVLVSMAPAQNMGAKPLLTNGDNAGVAHPLFMQPGGTTVGNPMILMGGMPASHLCNPTYGNNFNNPVGTKLVPSVTNVLLGYSPTLSPAQRAAGARLLRVAAGSLRMLPGGILSLRLPCIGLATDRWLASELAHLGARTVRGIALDLRGNPGGVMPAAVRIAARLGAVGAPIAIATDRHTASAAELLVASLTAATFGERTFGKARFAPYAVHARSMAPLAGGPTGTFAGGDGAVVDGVGIGPDRPCAPREAVAEAVSWLRQRTSC